MRPSLVAIIVFVLLVAECSSPGDRPADPSSDGTASSFWRNLRVPGQADRQFNVNLAILDDGVADASTALSFSTSVLTSPEAEEQKKDHDEHHATDMAKVIATALSASHSTQVALSSIQVGQGEHWSPSDVATGISVAKKHQARVVLLAAASIPGADRRPLTGIERAIKASSETLFVVPAGNQQVFLPAGRVFPCSFMIPNVVCVGSLPSEGDTPASAGLPHSGYGPAVALSAPTAEGPPADVNEFQPAGSEGSLDGPTGTSNSAALVAAMFASLLSRCPGIPPSHAVALAIESGGKRRFGATARWAGTALPNLSRLLDLARKRRCT